MSVEDYDVFATGNGRGNGYSSARGAGGRDGVSSGWSGGAGDEGAMGRGVGTGGGGQGKGLQQLHYLMRGRYVLAIVLGVVLGSLGAAGGFVMGKQTYQSVVTIRVTPTVQKVLYDTEERTISRYEPFVDTQIALIKGRGVTDQAMREQVWTSVNKDFSDKAVMKFINSVSAYRQNELLYIVFTADDPATAKAGAQAVINAYRKKVLEDETLSDEKRDERLQNLTQSLTTELQTRKAKLSSILSQSGGVDPQKQYEFQTEEVRRLQMTVDKLSFQASGTTRPSALGARKRTVEEWSLTDQTMFGLLEEQHTAEEYLEQLKASGFGEATQTVKQAQTRVRSVQDRIQRRVNLLEAADLERQGAASGDPTERQMASQQLEAARTGLEAGEKELKRLSTLLDQYNSARADIEETQRKLDVARERREQLSVEASAGGRIRPLGDAESPLGPANDTRVKFGAAGGLGGMILGVGIVLAMGLLDDRVRHSQEAHALAEMPPVLGVLPEVSERSRGDVERQAEVSRSLHLIRASLQLAGERGKCQVLTVTGPMPGSGKTSLTLGLGTSFGKSGARTLLVDFDLIGRGLSVAVAVAAHRRIGSLLLDQHAISSSQLAAGLAESERSGIKLGEALVKLGFVTREMVDEALARQPATRAGVVDALRGEPIERCVNKTSFENVWMMQAGDVQNGEIGTFSPGELDRLMEKLRKQFDCVLVDTGPLPGCVESSLAAAVADSVVVVMSRGESKRNVYRTLAAVRQVRGRCAGVVYNRAEVGDFAGSLSSTTRVMSKQQQAISRALMVENA